MGVTRTQTYLTTRAIVALCLAAIRRRLAARKSR
jgi:hypothetical protein